MKTPVIIPAYNDEKNIGALLRTLPRDLVEPIVSVSGSTDRTAAIAYNRGAKVMDNPELGKLPAIQRALRYLGDRALQPLIILDADAFPIFPKAWYSRMVGAMEDEVGRQSVVSGPVWFTPNEHSSYAAAATRSIYRLSETALSSGATRFSGEGGARHNPNLGLHIFDKNLLDEVLALDHYWPGDDSAITEKVVNDNDGAYRQLVCPAAMVLKSESSWLESTR